MITTKIVERALRTLYLICDFVWHRLTREITTYQIGCKLIWVSYLTLHCKWAGAGTQLRRRCIDKGRATVCTQSADTKIRYVHHVVFRVLAYK